LEVLSLTCSLNGIMLVGADLVHSMQSQQRRNATIERVSPVRRSLLRRDTAATAKLGELSLQSGGPHNMWDAFSSWYGIVN
jgi:hypothetical protein